MANEKEIQKGGDMCIHIGDSLCCTAETNNIINQLSSKKKKNPVGRNLRSAASKTQHSQMHK